MHEWSESQLMIRDAVRTFVENEIAPHVEELEHGDMPPYELRRRAYKTFGMDEMARARFAKTIEAEKRGEKPTKGSGKSPDPEAKADQAAATLIPIIELCRYCPGVHCSRVVTDWQVGAMIATAGERWATSFTTTGPAIPLPAATRRCTRSSGTRPWQGTAPTSRSCCTGTAPAR